MKLKHICIILIFSSVFLIDSSNLKAQERTDSLLYLRPHIHQISIESRPGYIFATNPFLNGDNEKFKKIEQMYSTHLKYSFQFQPYTYANRIYRGVYQGLGVTHFSIENSKEIGTPIALYIFQGATISQLSRKVSLNYEWNFGLSGGWEPYDDVLNPNNGMMGSRMNAYMNVNFYFKHQLSHKLDLLYGLTLSHFSNGNTSYPNAGLNSTDIKVGLSYNFNKDHNYSKDLYAARHLTIKKFPKHISTDVVLFGSWRRKGIIFNDIPMLSPDPYQVAGININPMYNIGYNTRFGLSLDGVYDSSANIYTEDYIVSGGYAPSYTFYYPTISKQLALGVSARGEYVMPYFTVGVGMGTNVLYKGEDFRGFYQVFALKVEITRSSFIHIGYNLQNFKDPNYLMLGIGYRFNNKYPRFYR